MRLVTAMSPSSLDRMPHRLREKSTWIAATSMGRPAATANGMTIGRDGGGNGEGHATPSRGTSGRSRVVGLREQGRRERDDERHAEHARDHGQPDRDRGSSTCETPREPQVNPPSGQSPRSQSIAVQRAAAPSAVRNGPAGSADQGERRSEQRDRERGEQRQGAPRERAEEHAARTA